MYIFASVDNAETYGWKILQKEKDIFGVGGNLREGGNESSYLHTLFHDNIFVYHNDLSMYIPDLAESTTMEMPSEFPLTIPVIVER